MERVRAVMAAEKTDFTTDQAEEVDSCLRGIRSAVDSMRYAAPEMMDFWLRKIEADVSDGLTALHGVSEAK